jgi:hypothetical protein
MAKDIDRELESAQDRRVERQPWQKMELSHLGDAANLIQSGGGKLSTTGGDPGENRKQRGGTS